VDLIHLALNRHQQRTLVNTIVNIRVPWNTESFLVIWATTSFSRMILFVVLVRIQQAMNWNGCGSGHGLIWGLSQHFLNFYGFYIYVFMALQTTVYWSN
jgi:hypothetical protein